MTRAEYAEHRGITPQAVYKAIRDGRIEADARGRIDWQKADAAWTSNTRAGTSGSAPPGLPGTLRPAGEITYANARALHEYFKAQLAQLELDRQTGRVLDSTLVMNALATRLRAAYELIQGIPDRIGDNLAVATDPADVRRLLQAELDDVCHQLEGSTSAVDAVSREQLA